MRTIADPPALVDLVAFDADEVPEISVGRAEFDQSLAFLVEARVIEEVDAERAWRRYAWLRSGYDTAIRGLAGLTQAPEAPWTSDRALRVGRPHFFSHRPMAMWEP